MSRAQTRPRVLLCDAKEIMNNLHLSVPVNGLCVIMLDNGPWARSRSWVVGPTYVFGGAPSNIFTCDILWIG
jgi:hypothetical protein